MNDCYLHKGRKLGHRWAPALWALLFSVLLFSCTADISLTIEDDDAGSLIADIMFHPLFVQYYRDLSTIAGDQLAPDNLEQHLTQYGKIEDLHVTRSEDWKQVNIQMHTQNLPALLQALDLPIIQESFEGSTRISLNPYVILKPSKRTMDFTILGLFLPPQVGYLKYIDDLSWALEEYATIAETQEMVDATGSSIHVNVPGTITEQEGGEIVREDAVKFYLDLKDILEQDRMNSLMVRYK